MKLIITGIVCAGLLFFSCKNELIDNPAQYSKLFMPQAVDYPAVRALVMTDTLQQIVFGAAFGGVESQSHLINVQFAVNAAMVDSFNRKNGTSYPVLPAASYQVEKLDADIPAGKVSSTPLRLTIKTVGGLEPSKQYVLPVTMMQTDATVPVNEDLRTTYFLISADYQEFNRPVWKVLETSSYEAPNVGENAFDNNTTTVWHTQWKNAKPPHPHYVTVNMNEAHTVHGFYFIPSNNSPTGNPQKVHVNLSMDGASWTNTGTFTFQNVYDKQTFYLATPTPAKYFKFVVDSSFANTHFTHLLEIGAF